MRHAKCHGLLLLNSHEMVISLSPNTWLYRPARIPLLNAASAAPPFPQVLIENATLAQETTGRLRLQYSVSLLALRFCLGHNDFDIIDYI
jgi:hypothetical protein